MKTEQRGQHSAAILRTLSAMLLATLAMNQAPAADLSLTPTASYQTAINVTYSNPTIVGNTLVVTVQIQNTSGTWVYIEQNITSTPKTPVNLPYTVYLLGPGGTKTFSSVSFVANSYLEFDVTTPIGLNFQSLDPKCGALFGALTVDFLTRGLLTIALPPNAFDESPANSLTGDIDPLLDDVFSTLGNGVGSLVVDLKNFNLPGVATDVGSIAVDSGQVYNSVSQILIRNGFTMDQVNEFFSNASGILSLAGDILNLPGKYQLVQGLASSTFGAAQSSWNRFDVVATASAPSISSVSPSTLTGLPLGQTQLIRIIGSGFTGSSTLTFNDGVNPSYTGNIPSSYTANELDYYISVGTSQAGWTVQVVNGSQTSNLGYFTVNAPPATPSGSLVVNLSPAGAVSAGAQWQVDGGVYYVNGGVATALSPGSHTVSFKPISGYTTPANQIVTINANAQTTASGTYTVNAPSPSTGSITVNITPSGAVSAGAQWRVDNGSYLNNGDVAVGLSPGSHTVSLKSVSGYNTPTNLVLSVVANQQITVNAIYAAIANCSYSLSAYSDIWAAAGGSGAFNVIAPAGCTWTASETLSWVTITSGSSGSGTHGVFYQVDYNSSLSPRSGVITAAGQSFTINQNGNAGACTFTLSAPGANVPAAGGTNSFSVYTGSICFWSISRNANWITLISQQDHTGSDSVQYTVQPYFGSLPRSAAILLSADGGQTFVATFTITQAGTPPPPGTLATGLSSPRSIAVDDNYVFWSEPSVLKRVSKTGAGETAVATSSLYGFGQMVLDGNYLYYLDSGTKVQQLLKSGGTPTTLATGSSFYDAITVQNNVVFWGVPSGLIYSVPTAGGSVTTVATGSQDIASIRVTNNTVVWSQTTYPAVVFAQPIGGSRITLSSGVNVEPGLAIQDGFAYFTGSESIYRVPIGGGIRQTLASNLNDAYDLALDATNIYWVEAGNPLGTNGSVRQMPLSGGPIITLATNLAQPVAITVDSTNVYWLENNNGSTTRSALKWAAKASIVSDVVSPSIAITNPADGAQFNESVLSVNGTAADNISVALVELQLNGGGWQTATGTTIWTGSVNLVSGTNAIQARSRDSAGNYSTIASILVTYSPPDTRLPQTITFGALSDQVFGDAPFALSATSSSGLPVYLNVLSGPAALDTNNVLTLLGAGTVTAIAWQPGNSNYNAAVPVQQSFNVSKSPQTITFGALSQQKVGDAPFSLYASSDSGLQVSFSISGPAVLNGNILTLTSWGTIVVTASQSGNASYAAATNVVQSFVVVPPDNTIVSPERLPNGSFQFAFYGLTGSNYLIQCSTNLTDWQLFTHFTGTNVLLYFNDSAAENFKQRFYRAVRP
jgi:hypothetical protein